MAKMIEYILFFGVFFGIYLFMHFYVLYRLFGFFDIKSGILLVILSSCLALLFPAGMILERKMHSIFSKAVYIISATWMGVLVFFIFALFVYEIIRLFLKINPKTAGLVIIAIVLATSIIALIFGSILTVKRTEIPLAGLEKELTIVHLSDIHLGSIHSKGYLEEIVKKTNNENPDIVLITGDLFDGGDHVTEDTLSPLNGISAETFFSIGNHEAYAGVDEKILLLKQTKVKVLRNEAVTYKNIQIIGIDDPAVHSPIKEFIKNNEEIKKINVSKEIPSVLMYHQPNGLKDANNAGVSLQVSGHTHDGQIFPFNFLVYIFHPYAKGLYNYNGTWLYVSPGTGTWGPPMRLGSFNEITVIHLVPRKV